jgi:hypothetical protein
MRNARASLLMGVMLLLCHFTWAAGDADAVISRYLDAIGGKAALAKVHSRVMKGSFNMPAMGMSAKMEIYIEPPDKYLSFIDFEGMSPAYSGVNGDTAWEINPMSGPRIFSGAEKMANLRRAQIDPLLNWKANYVKVEVGDDAQIQGKPCTKLMLTDGDGSTTTVYFDKETGLISRREDSVGGQTIQSDVSDYRKVGDVLAPYKLNVSTAQFGFEVTVDSIEDNVDIPSDKFDLPPDIKALMK